MSRKVSLKDIAKEVGVSTALVSYVLNNLKEGRIRKEVAERIREAARRLNYRPNQVARSLKTQKTNSIGLILADIANPFSSSLARIIEDEANKLAYTVLFGSSDENPEKFERLVDTFLNKQVDGLIISPPENSETALEQLQKQEVPFVLLDRYFPSLNTNYVLLDNYRAAHLATTHLLTQGCDCLGMITYATSLAHLQDRERGFVDALKQSDLQPSRALIQRVGIDNEPEEIGNALDQLLSNSSRVNGILFASNIIAVQCLRILNRSSIRVPGDVKVVCFDESPFFDLFYAPLTFVRQPLRQMGEAATRILTDNIRGTTNITQLQMDGELSSTHSSTELR
jgi:LacI family transcriptional regulator